jgi:hypothetical protein
MMFYALVYQMSIYLLPKTVVYRLDKIRRTFFWQGGGTKKKYYLIKWPKICKSKKKGGPLYQGYQKNEPKPFMQMALED